jgi:hypothetical protein
MVVQVSILRKGRYSKSCCGLSSNFNPVSNHFCLYCADFFRLGVLKILLTYPHLFYGPINCILLSVSWSSLLLLVFLHPFISMSRFHSYIKVVGQLKYYILPIEIVSALHMVPKHCSEFSKFVNTYFRSYVLSLLVWNFTSQTWVCERICHNIRVL